MPSYVVTGASRGLGYAFITHLAKDSSNTVIGLARNKAATDSRLAKDDIKNVTILQADILDSLALQAAAAETARITGGGLDVLINNAAYVSEETSFETMAVAESEAERIEKDFLKSFEINVIGVVKTMNAFLPLLKKGTVKKVISISTGMADNDFINEFDIAIAAPYAVSKAALNTLVAKYNTAYKKDRILFMAISPGFVNTAEGKKFSEEELAGVQAMITQFADYAPGLKGPITPQESVEQMLRVVDNATIERGDSGSFVSHLGTKRWL
ncbi:hypothetical protein H2201_007122 [Coniosporium apollinis]|uniref:Short chain dehydrogenase n=2 Tax=Coniosporium TaxID=2810619 RepID=A0ABQ9NJY8_9PEZI|nr:hypothetical protein H2199_004012 [Cladosporium sp. JES 115]KAJ9660017.1 hypothetical protein H2201_007122 [Coniosporium apollinis]